MSALSSVVATPTVTVVVTSPAASANGSRNASTTRSAVASTAAVLSALPMSSANSSPPSRAAVSDSRTSAVSRAGGGHQQLVADAVAHRVVDDLEVVQVDEQHAGDPSRPPGGGDLLRDPVLEQQPVGQPGQRVVEGPVLQLLLELVLLGHVPQGEHQAAHGRVGAQVAAPGLDVDAPAVAAG